MQPRRRIHLHKFICYRREVLQSVPPKERAASVKEVDLNNDDLPLSCTLGIQWDVEKDEFFFRIETKEAAFTCPKMLSLVASVFDPLGLLAPFVLTGKVMLQHMCRNGSGWDDPLPAELEPWWEKWVSDLPNIAAIRIPRCLKPSLFGEVKSTQLHHFSDTSTLGFGQCSQNSGSAGQGILCTSDGQVSSRSDQDHDNSSAGVNRSCFVGEDQSNSEGGQPVKCERNLLDRLPGGLGIHQQ